jgi:hypothetical protein
MKFRLLTGNPEAKIPLVCVGGWIILKSYRYMMGVDGIHLAHNRDQ